MMGKNWKLPQPGSSRLKRLLVPLFAFSLVPSITYPTIEIYVSDAGNFEQPPWKIVKTDENGENAIDFITENLDWPQDILFLEDSNTVLISNLNSGRITRYNSETGAYIDNFATSIAGPTRMKIGPDNLLYVLQWNGSGTVRKYGLDGNFIGNFSNTGVSQSIGIDWDSDGNLYVSSFDGRFIRKFDPSGNDLGMFISTNLQGPTNIWFEPNGELLVSDWSGTGVQRYDANGNFLNTFITGLSQSEGVDFFPNGDILMGNGATGDVKMFDSNGSFIKNLITRQSSGLLRPNAIVIRGAGEPETFQINAGLNGSWLNPSTPGQGFFLEVYPKLGLVFLAWFTYETTADDGSVVATVGHAGHRWVTGFGPFSGDTATLDIINTSGGLFDDPTAVTESAPQSYGSITLKFNDCSGGIFDYTLFDSGLSGTLSIGRIVAENVPLCTDLADVGVLSSTETQAIK